MPDELPAHLAASERLRQQLAFVVEADKLKTILRQNRVASDPGARRENDAEHSFHLALMAMILAEHSDVPVDLPRVMKMVLIHDLVEIDAGDTFVYDAAAQVGQHEREALAADRIFGLLPADQAAEMRALWDEFEAKETPEARFAGSLDRLEPVISNYRTQGGVWKEHQIGASRVFERNAVIARGSESLWTFTRGLLEDAVRKGDLAPD